MKIQTINNYAYPKNIQTFKGTEDKAKSETNKGTAESFYKMRLGIQSVLNPNLRAVVENAKKDAHEVSNNASGIINRARLHGDAVPKSIIWSGDMLMGFAATKAEILKEAAQIAKVNNYAPMQFANGKVFCFEKEQDDTLLIFEIKDNETLTEAILYKDGSVEVGRKNPDNKDASDIFTLHPNGIAQLQIGVKQIEDGVSFIDELYGYKDGTLINFIKHLNMKDINNYKQRENFEFKDGRITVKMEDYEFSNGVSTCEKVFCHNEDGSLREYIDKITVDSKGISKYNFTYLFDNDKSFQYHDRSKNIVIKDGKLKSYIKFKPFAREENTIDYFLSFNRGKLCDIRFAK